MTDTQLVLGRRAAVPGAALESPPADDVEARRLLQGARGAFQKWPEGFAGFSTSIRCHVGAGAIGGRVSIFTRGRIELDLRCDDGLAAWLTRALGAIARARTPRFFKDGDGRLPITFEPDRHPLGRGVRVHLDRRCSRVYRIDSKGRVRQQDYARPAPRATVTYAELMRACPGRLLPTRVQMLEWDVTAQAVVGIADIEDTYERYQHVCCQCPTAPRSDAARTAATSVSSSRDRRSCRSFRPTSSVDQNVLVSRVGRFRRPRATVRPRAAAEAPIS